MDYILDHRLKNPEANGTNKQSSGVDVEDIEYQKFLKEFYRIFRENIQGIPNGKDSSVES